MLTRDDWFKIAAIILFGVVFGFVGLVVVQRGKNRPPEVYPPVVDESFEAWHAEHQKTCKQCYESMNENPDVGLCMEAFEKLKDSVK